MGYGHDGEDFIAPELSPNMLDMFVFQDEVWPQKAQKKTPPNTRALPNTDSNDFVNTPLQTTHLNSSYTPNSAGTPQFSSTEVARDKYINAQIELITHSIE